MVNRDRDRTETGSISMGSHMDILAKLFKNSISPCSVLSSVTGYLCPLVDFPYAPSLSLRRIGISSPKPKVKCPGNEFPQVISLMRQVVLVF